MSLRAVLWDLDGTLVDSNDHHWRAWREVLAPLGVDLTREAYAKLAGLTSEHTVPVVLGRVVPADETARIVAEKERLFREDIRRTGLALLPGARAWIERLRQARWRQAIASTAGRRNLELMLGAAELNDTFDVVVHGELASRGKPDPELFLVAAERLGVPSTRCVVVEDSHHGVEAAHRAGMPVIGVGPVHQELASDLAVPSLLDLPGDVFDGLLGDGR